MTSNTESIQTGLSQPVHQVAVEQHVKIPMRDGTLLDATIWRPRTAGRYPVIVERVGYELMERCGENGTFYARRGYVYAGQSVRGIYGSQGEYRYARNDGWGANRDGYDTVEWAGTQAWSTGAVGMVDGSYSGTMQYLLAPTRPPHLNALFVREGGAHAHVGLWSGGAFKLALHLGAFLRHIQRDVMSPGTERLVNEGARRRLQKAIEEQESWERHLPLMDCAPLKDVPQGRDYFQFLEHPEDGPFWEPWNLLPRVAEVDVPSFHLGGWADVCLLDTLQAFVAIRAGGRTAHCRENQRLVVGPWEHGPESLAHGRAGEVDFGPEAAFDLRGQWLRWYDHWLKGVENGVMDGPVARVFLMGANRWLDLDGWPPEEASPRPLYLREGSGATAASLNSGRLSFSSPAAAEKPDGFAYDPRDPVPSLVSWGDYGPHDYRSLEGRMLTYTSDVLQNDLAIVGPVRAVLYGLSSAPDTDWVVRLCDVYPDGRSMSVTDGILRARYRDALERAELMTPGRIYRFEIELLPTAQVFLVGHRIRVHVTSSDFPRYDRNVNTGGVFGEEVRGQVAINTVFHDRMRPSHLVLPVYPLES